MSFQIFETLIATNSIYPHEQQITALLSDILKENGFFLSYIPLSSQYQEHEIDTRRYNIVATKGNGKKKIIFYAHMDTVPIHDTDLWNTDPCMLTQDSKNPDIYYGLGSVDMKGGLWCILEATKDITIEDYTIVVIFGCDEECWSKGAWSLIEHPEIFKGAVCMLVPEIGTATHLNPNKKGIILGRRGRIIIELEIPGKSSHGAIADHGINAITQASILCQEIEKRQYTKQDAVLPGGNQFVKSFSAHVSSLSIPDTAKITIDRHIVTGETFETVQAEYKEIIADLYTSGVLQHIDGRKIKIQPGERPTPTPMPYTFDPQLPIIQDIKKSINDVYGDSEYQYGYSVADENVFATLGIPVITIGPTGGNEHGANERVSKLSLEKLISFYQRFLKNL